MSPFLVNFFSLFIFGHGKINLKCWDYHNFLESVIGYKITTSFLQYKNNYYIIFLKVSLNEVGDLFEMCIASACYNCTYVYCDHRLPSKLIVKRFLRHILLLSNIYSRTYHWFNLSSGRKFTSSLFSSGPSVSRAIYRRLRKGRSFISFHYKNQTIR